MAATDPRNPRYRPFRAAVYAVYLTVVTAFCLLVIVGVVRSVRRMTPDRPPSPDTLLTPRECVEGAQALFDELETARRSLERGEDESEARGAAERWSDFRVAWLANLRGLEARCAPEARSRVVLLPVFQDLERVLDLYTTHAVQYAGEVGPTVDRLREDLRAARRDPSMGRLP
ncbi:MAG: hypothetical protein L0Y66_00110 [Myxococcaceae bacterium]|nr:hypothetical protein [Myxococcaceae bacterium]MCI0671987.1 hypothetical protein [Myxococcaceae bacterium]